MFNVQTLMQPGCHELLAKTLNERDVVLAGLAETREAGQMNYDARTPNPNSSHLRHPRYRLYLSGPTDGSGTKGVGFAVSSQLDPLVEDWKPISDRVAVIQLRTVPIPTIAVCGYAPTNCADDASKDAFYDLMNAALNGVRKDYFVIVLGDFNATLGKPFPGECQVGPHSLGDRNDNGDRFYALLEHHNLVAVNTFFRHKRRHLETWASNDRRTRKQLDYICLRRRFKGSALSCRSWWGNSLQSDHAVLVANLALKLSRRPPIARATQLACDKLMDPASVASYQQELARKLARSDEQSVDARWENMKSCMSTAAEAALGKRRPNRSAWISQRTIELVDARRSAQTFNERRNLTRMIKDSILDDKEAYWGQQAMAMNEATRRGDSGRLFRMLKKATGKASGVSDIIEETNGDRISSKSRRMERWKEHFEAALNCPPSRGHIPDWDYEGWLNISDVSPSLEEIMDAMRTIRSNSAPGDDDLGASLFKAGGPALAQRMLELCELIWVGERFPEAWKTSVVVPVFKKGSKSSCANYRPISLINVAYKVFEAVILKRIRSEVDANLRENQGGFRPGRSTVDQIFALRQILEQRNEYNQPLAIAFVDFKAAFDSIDREKMYKILHDFGLPVKIVSLIRQMYLGGSSVVRTGRCTSAPFPVKSGVKQGALLSPVLFNIVLDAVLRWSIDNDCDGVRVDNGRHITDMDYADDIALLAENAADLQRLLDRLDANAALVGLNISAQKTKVLFGSRSVSSPILLRGQVLEEVTSFTYLGSCITSDGDMSREIRTRIAKAQSAFSQLNGVLWKDRDISLATKMKVYMAAIRPVLLYACETWSQKVEETRRLRAFEFRCWRFILGVTFTDRITNDEIAARIAPRSLCESDVVNRRLCYLGHILRRHEGFPARRTFLAPCPAHWKRRPGRPRETWQRTVLDDLKPLHLGRVYNTWPKKYKEILADIATDRRQFSMMMSRAAAAARS